MTDFVSAEDIAKLQKAIISGTLEVEYSDKRVRYRSLDEMIRILQLAEQKYSKKKSSWNDRIIKVEVKRRD